ncbi:MAG: GerMN domain-containing protein [Deltaproteobacteria bacterium]|nr:GerMN domain-containing protein [Deltaproteobacteria bacterium]
MAAIKRFVLCLLGAFLVASFAGAKESPIDATALYRQTFGPPPKTDGQKCLAAVVFLPGIGSSGAPDKLSPVPLFSVSPGKVVEEAARVLVEGHPTQVRELKLPRLFPEGSKLTGVRVAGKGAVVAVTPGGAGQAHPLALQALAHTLSQFNGIGSVTLEIHGRAALGPETPRAAVIEPPPPPRLLDVILPIHRGEKPSEIDVLFDRPVEIVTVSIGIGGRKPFPGKTYTSMFDMAVVFRPDDPKEIRENLPLDVRWSVRDKVGRKAEGTRTLPVRIYTHPE